MGIVSDGIFLINGTQFNDLTGINLVNSALLSTLEGGSDEKIAGQKYS